MLLELRTAVPPSDDSTRNALAQYAAALVQQVPGVRYLTLSPGVAATGAADYAAAYVPVHDAVKAVLPGVALAPLVDGSSSPKATLTALARTLPAADVDVIAFHPAAATATGWGADAVPQLLSTLEDVFGRAPPVLIDGLATPTTIPSDQRAWYPKSQLPDPSAVAAREQGNAYARLIAATACSTTISAIVLDRLVDDNAVPEPTSGIVYASGAPKASASLVSAAAGPTQRGTVVCPGLASRSGASTLQFPAALDDSASASVVLGCVRDCLYVITLADAAGRPVTARRGTLAGGGRPLRLELPKAKLSAAGYRFDVRIVDRVNPGEVSRTTSALLPVSRP